MLLFCPSGGLVGLDQFWHFSSDALVMGVFPCKLPPPRAFLKLNPPSGMFHGRVQQVHTFSLIDTGVNALSPVNFHERARSLPHGSLFEVYKVLSSFIQNLQVATCKFHKTCEWSIVL